MNKETIRELRERADGMITAGIANKDALFAALPLLTKLQAKAESARKNLAASVKALTMLSELCSRYALAHESVFEKKRLITNQQGVRTGDIVTDEATSHFASGYDYQEIRIIRKVGFALSGRRRGRVRPRPVNIG